MVFVAWAARAEAQGFAVERLYLSPPGAGYFALDDLSFGGGLSGAASLSIGYGHKPLQTTVEHQAFADIGLSVSYDRLRLSAHFSSPLYVAGIGTAANVEQNPDTISDVPLTLDVLLLGQPLEPARLGASVSLDIPSGSRADYLTDDAWRAAGRLLFAGDAGGVSYAGHLGVHLRSLDLPGGPRGSELLFGAAARMSLGPLRLGPEVFGTTAFRDFFGSDATALEGLLAAHYQSSSNVRFKLGAGAGIHPRFGAPQWRAVIGVEIFGAAAGGSKN